MSADPVRSRRVRLVLRKILLMGVIAALVVSACGDKSADLDPSDAVNIRMRNETGAKIERLWLGSSPSTGSTFQTRYTDIDNNAVTDYLTVEPDVDNYRRLNLTIDGERFFGSSLNPHVALEVDSLSAGSYYTFVLVLDGNDIALSEVTIDDE